MEWEEVFENFEGVGGWWGCKMVVDGSCGEVGEKSLGRELPVYFPTPKLSGDNGAMVGAAAYYEIESGVGAAAYYEIESGVEPVDAYALNIYPRISIEG